MTRACACPWKNYRAKGRAHDKTMTLSPQEFMRRFLLHVLPGGFHRIRHFGLLANGNRHAGLARVREALHVGAETATKSVDAAGSQPSNPSPPAFVCRHYGRALVLVQTFVRGEAIRAPPTP